MKNLLKNKKIIIAVILGIIFIIAYSFIGKEEEVVSVFKEREYTAKTDTITVGIEADGLIDTVPNIHTFADASVLKTLYVKLGSEVKVGDELAKIDLENLAKTIKTSTNKVADAQAGLIAATSARDVFLKQNQSNANPADKQNDLAYEQQLNSLESGKTKAAAEISYNSELLKVVDKDLIEITAVKAQEDKSLKELQDELAANLEKIAELEGSLPASAPAPDSDILAVSSSEVAVSSSTIAVDVAGEIAALKERNMLIDSLINTLENSNTGNTIKSLTTDKRLLNNNIKTNELLIISLTKDIKVLKENRVAELSKRAVDANINDYSISRDLENMAQTIKKAEREVEVAAKELSELNLLSANPVLIAKTQGIVTVINYAEGEQIFDAKPLLTIGKLDEITMNIAVDAADIGNIKIGQKVNINVDAFTEEKFTAKVVERLLVANDDGEYEVIVALDKTDTMILPGMKAYATIIVKEKPDVLTIANKAIILEDGVQYVTLKMDDGTKVKKEIVTGFSDGKVSEILKGLSASDIAIVEE